MPPTYIVTEHVCALLARSSRLTASAYSVQATARLAPTLPASAQSVLQATRLTTPKPATAPATQVCRLS